MILTAVAMAADLVVPWVNLDGQHIAPANFGLPALFVVAILGAAVLPVVRPEMRRRALYASFPLVIGAVGFGAAVVIWVRILYSQHAADVAAGSGNIPAVYASDAGLYLFLVGASVLIVAGYQVLVAAAVAEALSGVQAPRVSTAIVPPPSAVAPVPRAAFESEGNSLGSPAVAVASANGTEAAAQAGAGPVPAATPAAGPSPVPLPGTAAWTETPQLPGYGRPSPSGGWARQRHVRRHL